MKIGIAGAGILGQLLAFQLSELGHAVTIFEEQPRGSLENSSMAAAGLLSPITELDKCPQIISQLGLAALKSHWPKVLKQLKAEIYFQNKGTLVLAHPQDKENITQFLQLIDSKKPAKNYAYKLTGSQLEELEPTLKGFAEGYFFPEEGQIDNQTLLQVLAKRLSANNVEQQFQQKVSHVLPKQIVLEDGIFHADLVIDCRGVGAQENFADIRGIRGELYWMHAPMINITRPIRLIHPRFSLYLAPRPNQCYIIGATEIEAESLNPITLRSTLELLSAVYSLHRSFGEAMLLKSVVHCRPTLADHLPKIKYQAGMLAVNGLYRHGFLIVPTLVADILYYLRDGINACQYAVLWEQMHVNH